MILSFFQCTRRFVKSLARLARQLSSILIIGELHIPRCLGAIGEFFLDLWLCFGTRCEEGK